jgi:hypothetical protein
MLSAVKFQLLCVALALGGGLLLVALRVGRIERA